MRKILSLVGAGIISGSSIGATTLASNSSSLMTNFYYFSDESLKETGRTQLLWDLGANKLSVLFHHQIFSDLILRWTDDYDWNGPLIIDALKELFTDKFEVRKLGPTDFKSSDFLLLAKTFYGRIPQTKLALKTYGSAIWVSLEIYRNGTAPTLILLDSSSKKIFKFKF